MDRRQALANHNTLPNRAQGCVLFTDISGFTPLTSTMTKELGHTRAAEAITHQLNRFYAALIVEVHRYRGSVIGFVGDAITCWFAEDEGLRATACALAMQQAMVHFREVKTPGGAVISLAIKVAVVRGAVRRFAVGDPAIQLVDAMAGQPLEKMARAEKNAHGGQVVIADEIAHQFGERLLLTEWLDDERSALRFAVVSGLKGAIAESAWPDLPSDGLYQVKSWLLPPVYERMMSEQGHFLAEFRPATALFLRFTGMQYEEDEAAGEKLDGYIRWVQGVLARYDGYLIQLTIGDKGSFLYAAFGAPIAHDDDPVRAVRAALELLNTPAEFSSFLDPVQLGLAHGIMRTGTYGSPARHTYGVISDKTNLAARLMGATSPGSILCDFDVYRHAHQAIAFDTLAPIRIKGKVGLIPVYRPTDQVQPAHSIEGHVQSPLVGRDTEIARMQVALDEIERGKNKVLIMQGEAGIGKSRLVGELLDLMKERGLTGLLGAGQSIEQQSPYRAWRDILSSYFALDEPLDANQLRERVQAIVQEVAPDQVERLPLLNSLLNLGFPENDLTAYLDAKWRQQSLSLLIIGLLQAWAKERPLIIVLEDAHWLDSLSWELAVQVVRGLSRGGSLSAPIDDPLLFVLVTRPLDERAWRPQLESLQAMEIAESLPLSTLSNQQIVALVEGRLGVSIPPVVAQLIYQRAEGNPFFAEELLFTLLEQQFIRLEEDADGTTCLVSDNLAQAKRTLPDTLQGVILARIDRLAPQKQVTLKVAAVIGRTFDYVPLHYTLNEYSTVIGEALTRQLSELTAQDFTRLETPEPDLSYIFKHIIIQEVAYQTLLFAQRRHLHHTVASWYEQTFGGAPQSGQPVPASLAPYLPLLVHHYHHAENNQRERTYAKLAGEQAAAQHANQEAIDYFSRALELTPEHNLSVRYELRLAREAVYDRQGKRDLQKQDLQALRQLAAYDEEKQATVSLRQAKYARRTGDYAQALSVVQQAIEYAAPAEKQAMQAEGHYIWGLTLRKQANYAAAQQQLEQALALARISQQPKIEADSLQQLGTINYYRGNLSVASAYYQQALPIYHATNNRQGEGSCLVMLGLVHTDQGDYLSGQRQFGEALTIYQTIGYRLGETIVLGNLGTNYCGLGEYEYARDYQQQALAMSQEIGDREGESFAFCNLALLDYRMGEVNMALKRSQQALTVHRELGDRHNEGYTLTYLGHALAASGQLEQATDAYQKARQIRRQLGQESLVMDDLAGLARVAMKEGKLKQARTYVDEMVAWTDANGVEGIEYPLEVYLTCYQVLQAHAKQDPAAGPRAQTILTTAHTLLQKQAANIKDERLRRSFLENVSFNREIMAIWAGQVR